MASIVEAEGMGLEPLAELVANESTSCTCGKDGKCRAANALLRGDSQSQLLAIMDSDLRKIVDLWPMIPAAIREAVMGLVEYAEVVRLKN